MDENYLDNLLNEFSLDKEIDNKIEDELDNQMQEEKQKRQDENAVSREDAFNMDLEQEANLVTEDDDLHFSEEQMDELDQLDNLADLDIGEMDFSDIDFDDLDITKLNDDKGDTFDDILKDFEGDLEIDDFFDKEEKVEESIEKPFSDIVADSVDEDVVSEPKSTDIDDTVQIENTEESIKNSEIPVVDDAADENEDADLNEDTFDADTFLDSLLEESEMAEANEQPIIDLSEKEPAVQESDSYDAMAAIDGFTNIGQVEENPVKGEDDAQGLSKEESDELDDLFSMLNMEEAVDITEADDVSVKKEPEQDISLEEDLDDEPEQDEQPVKKEKGFVRLLFGEPDEDDVLSEEEIAEMEAKKAAKKAKKKAAKEAKKEKAEAAKEEKAVKNGQKKKEENERKRIKAEKKAKKKAEELANQEPEKKLNTPMVVFVFSLFLGGTFLFYLASNNFNYTQAIEKAANYFANQRYRSAYDEIVGVEVKEKDQELKNRIYTVMYVERLYESYENNIELGREEKALDSLLRGVDKYYEHYEEAVELGIVSDLDYSFAQIQNVLLQRYGITVEQAVEINTLENYEYVEKVNNYIIQADVALPEEENITE